MAWSWQKIALVAGGTVVGGAACFLTAGAAAPAIGAALGSAMGLSGAAATSAGLAAIGGGAVAVGGGGMAAGTAFVTAALTGAGGLLGTLGMGTVANFMRDSDKEFEKAIFEQKDYSKAQSIILEQEKKIRSLQTELSRMRADSSMSQEKVKQLEEAIRLLSNAVAKRREQLRQAV